MRRHPLTVAAATIAMLGVGMSSATAVANAQEGGQRTGAVQFWAEDLGDCKVEFTIRNTTNVTSFTLDWRIDNEPLRFINGVPWFAVGRLGGMHSTVLDGPKWPDDIPTEGENTVENRWMKSGLPASEVSYVQDLKNIDAPYNPALPNPEADTHKVDYRMVLGPAGNNAETPSNTPEWIGDRGWHSVTVTGCNPTDPPEPDPDPDPDPGSLANLFGSLGSSGGTGSTGSLASLGRN